MDIKLEQHGWLRGVPWWRWPAERGDNQQLGCGTPRNDMEVPRFADRAEWFPRFRDSGWGRHGGQQLPAALEHALPIAIGKKAVVSDLDKAAGQHMKEEPSDELDGIEGHFFDLVAVLRIPPAEAHLVVLQAQ